MTKVGHIVENKILLNQLDSVKRNIVLDTFSQIRDIRDDYYKMGYVYFGYFIISEFDSIIDLDSFLELNIDIEPEKNNFFTNLEEHTLTKRLIGECFYNNGVIFGYENEQIVNRNDLIKRIRKGAVDFCKVNSLIITEKSRYEISKVIANYIDNHLTYQEKYLVNSIYCIKSFDSGNYIVPMSIREKWAIGIINPWPGDKSAEAEVLTRIQKAAHNIDIDYIMLDNFGHILNDDTQKASSVYVNPADLDFIITTHYETEKVLDAYYYHTVWNPPEIPLNLGDYDTRITNNYLMNDDYLIYDFGGMSNHLKSILIHKGRTLKGASSLTASFPKSEIIKPKLDDPKLFYCGMNWEKIVHNSSRHSGLFELLDKTGKVKFFGPDKVEAWGGLRPWEGYECYQYPIPFDGFSILKEINDCGICLVISSDIHRRAGAATNRTYEACAAGAVIISDDNEFMKHHFKDAALFIKYNKNNPKDTFSQIMEKYQWIIDNPKEALVLAENAQQIFLEKFALEDQLLRIIDNHKNRTKTIINDLYSIKTVSSQSVLVSFVLNTTKKDEIKNKLVRIISNLSRQHYKKIIFGVVCDKHAVKYVKELLSNANLVYNIFELNLYDDKNSRQVTDSQALRLLYNNLEFDYFINTNAHEEWFSDHITTLIRSLEDDEHAYCSYSGRAHRDQLGYSRVDFFDVFKNSTIYEMNHPDWFPVPGQLLFKASILEGFEEFMDPFLDGYEHYYHLNVNSINRNRQATFSKRMTMIWDAYDIDQRSSVISEEHQIRFIRSLVKYKAIYSENQTLSSISELDIKRLMLVIPFKAFIRSKFYKFIYRKVQKSSFLRNYFERKLNKSEEIFLK